MTPLLVPLVALAHAAEPPDGLQPMPIADVVVDAVPPELAGCLAAMTVVNGNVTRWVGCGERILSVVGSPAVMGVDVAGLLDTMPASLSHSFGVTVRGEPTSLTHAGQTLPALRLTRMVGEARVTMGLVAAWPGGEMRELAMCVAEDDPSWCEPAMRALLTPARPGDAAPGRSMALLMEPAPDGVDAPGRLLQPVDAPSGGALIGCHRYADVEEADAGRMDCTQGRVVVEPVAAGIGPAAAREKLLPYLSVNAPGLRADGEPRALTIGGRSVMAAPIVGDGVRGFVVTDPANPNPRALGCLDRAPGLTRTPWCTVALEAMWGPSAGDAPPDKVGK